MSIYCLDGCQGGHWMNFKDLIYHGTEERNLEYKSSMSWNDISTKTKVVIACLAIANIPDGGTLIFGEDEISKGVFKANGMREEEADSFNQDDISNYVNGYADPYVDIKVNRENDDGKAFIIIQIQEFSELPVVCKKDGDKGIRIGAIYTRPRRKVESVPVPSQNEMREIIDLAVDKKMRKIQENLFKWGIRTDQIYQVTNDDKFDEQLGGL